MTADQLGIKLASCLKHNGFKKNKLTWFKTKDLITVVFGMQKSQFSSDVWFYNLGIGINQLYETKINTISKCDIIYRLDQQIDSSRLAPEQIIRIVKYWDEEYGDINKLRTRAIEGNLPPATTRIAYSYLTSGIV